MVLVHFFNPPPPPKALRSRCMEKRTRTGQQLQSTSKPLCVRCLSNNLKNNLQLNSIWNVKKVENEHFPTTTARTRWSKFCKKNTSPERKNIKKDIILKLLQLSIFLIDFLKLGSISLSITKFQLFEHFQYSTKFPLLQKQFLCVFLPSL